MPSELRTVGRGSVILSTKNVIFQDTLIQYIWILYFLQLYLLWAMRQYPKIKDAEELLDVAFWEGIVPAMRDQIIEKNKNPQNEGK